MQKNRILIHIKIEYQWWWWGSWGHSSGEEAIPQSGGPGLDGVKLETGVGGVPDGADGLLPQSDDVN